MAQRRTVDTSMCLRDGDLSVGFMLIELNMIPKKDMYVGKHFGSIETTIVIQRSNYCECVDREIRCS